MLTVSLTPPDESTLIASAQKRMDVVTALVIASPADYALASDELAQIKGKAKELDDLRKGIVKPLDEARQKIQDLFRRPLELLTDAEKRLKGSMLSYREAEERKRQEEQRRIDEAARKERARLAAEAAAIEAKARQQAEETRRKAAEAEAARLKAIQEGNAKAAAAAAERNAKLAEKADMQEAAGVEKAAELATISELVVAPTVLSEAPKVAGQSIRRIWRARVTDKQLFLLAIANNPQYTNLVDVNQSALDKLAKALEANFRLDGAEAYAESSLSSRSA